MISCKSPLIALVLGFVYEYLIEKFASNAGKKAGEFYTPHEVSVLMSEIVAEHLKGKDEIKRLVSFRRIAVIKIRPILL